MNGDVSGGSFPLTGDLTLILLIPGTSSEAHLREDVNAASLGLPVHARAALNATGAGCSRPTWRNGGAGWPAGYRRSRGP